MGAICIFLLRGCNNLVELKKHLGDWSDKFNCTTVLFPQSFLWESITLCENDVIFEVVDRPWESDCSIFLSYDGYTINGIAAQQPLYARLCNIQTLASICGQYANKVEIYLGEESTYLPDYESCIMPYSAIAEVVYNRYTLDEQTPFLPCLHILPL